LNWVRIACAAAGAAMAVTASAVAAAPLDVYGRLPTIEQATISADGQELALITNDGDAQLVSVRRVDDPKPLMTLRTQSGKVRGLRWVGSDHLLITASFTGKFPEVFSPRTEWAEVIDINVKAGTKMNLLGGARNAIPATIGEPQIRYLHGRPYAFVQACYFVNDEGRISLFRVDLSTGETALAAIGASDTDGWLVSPNGAPLAESRYDATGAAWSLFVNRSDGWRLADQSAASYGDDSVLGLGRDGRSVMISAVKDGQTILLELPPGADHWNEPLVVADERNLIVDPTDERLIGYDALVGEADSYVFFDPADQAKWDAAAKLFPGARVTLSGLTADRAKLLVDVESPTDPPAYDIVDTTTHDVQPVGAAYAKLAASDVAAVSPVAFQAADGLHLTGYLTLPKGRDPKGLPLVVFPHGGPAARDEPGFDWWAQAMAAGGYAVLQVNYRGSDGFGDAFLGAGFGQWGRKMQTDLSDGVRYLAKQGTIDPRRVCIVGASYGGYAALAGVTLDPGVYRCAVDVSGISDMRRFIDWSAGRSSIASRRYWTRYIGASSPKDPVFEQVSPLEHIDAVNAPILIIHGKDDTVVPFEQSQMMADALKQAGKPYDFVTLNHEDHWLSHGDTRLQMLQATMDFLAKNNPAQ
jgi:dipeptidyl aminopeptidase/acylaminoacyl peptidase